MAKLAKQAGLDGVVASPHEIELIRAACGPGFVIVTPGVRPVGADIGDQKRVMTPKEAVEKGADYLVIGRPITKADAPKTAAREIATEI
jgi:orotidine-5'-phosphate decarboxylase